MRKIISALLLVYSSLTFAASAPAGDPKPLELAPDAPDRHVVVRGDTLWGISGMFLKDPFRWPELWKLNDTEIKNPHWIYPGQVLILDRSGASPRLRLGNGGNDSINTVKVQPQVRSEDLRSAIPAIPQEVIEPFLSQPLVAEENALEASARIVAVKDDRVIAATGDLIYVTGADAAVRQWQIFRPGKPLVDPDSGEKLGFEATLLGSAQQLQPGDPATMQISGARQEIGRNDRLIPAPKPDIVNYPQHAPDGRISGRVISVYGEGLAGSRYSIVGLSRGRHDGLQVGHVLAIYRSGQRIEDRYKNRKTAMTLPEERSGLLYVFRTFDRVSYALVMETNRQVEVGDAVRNP